MAVNNMTKEQVYTITNLLAQEAQAVTNLTVTDYSSFISVANSILAVGTEKALSSLMNVIQRTIIAVRPYDEKFKGLEMTGDQWGAITRKISFADRYTEEEDAYTDAVTDGATVDPWTIRKPSVLETRYYGSDVMSSHYTVYDYQLREAFASPENLGSFISGLMTHFQNERTQWLEVLKKGLLVNAIATKQALNQDVVNLRTEYNTETGLSLTLQDLYKPDNFKPFFDWAYSHVAKVSREFTSRSQKYQEVITGKPIMRNTPYQDQRIYMLAEFLEQISSRVYANTYHDNFLTLADVEAVDFWQALNSPGSINAKPVYIDASAEIVEAENAVELNNVVGIIFDRDAMGYNIYNDMLASTPLNPRGLYYNIFSHLDVRLGQDFTEKICIFTLN